MGTFLFYLLKSGGCLILFYILFKLLLSRHTFFGFNRFTLLLGMSVCTLLPLVEITTSEANFFHLPLQTLQEVLEAPKTMMLTNETIPEVLLANHTDTSVISWLPAALGYLYVAGGIVTFSWLLFSTLRMFQLIHCAKKTKYGKYVLAIAEEPISSFSWGKYIVISQTDYQQQSEEIILHETMHLRHRHTLDLIYMQLFLVVYWFNPAIWLLKRELQEIHEFEADNGVLNTGIDATKYQLLLVKKAVGTRLYSMTNGFNHSKLKKRITMMLKERTNRWARLKLLFVVPAMAGAIYVFARPEVKETFVMATEGINQEVNKENYETLRTFFKKEMETYQTLSKGKTLKSKISTLLINKNNEILFDSHPVTLHDLQSIVEKKLLNAWEKGQGKYTQTINYKFDRGTSISELAKILQKVKNAYVNVRQKIAAESSNKSEDYLDTVFPILVVESVSQPYGQLKEDKTIKGVEVTLFNAENNTKKTLRNFTLKQLKKELSSFQSSSKSSKALTVGLKVNKGCSMKTVDEIKQALRNACVLRVNYKETE